MVIQMITLKNGMQLKFTWFYLFCLYTAIEYLTCQVNNQIYTNMKQKHRSYRATEKVIVECLLRSIHYMSIFYQSTGKARKYDFISYYFFTQEQLSNLHPYYSSNCIGRSKKNR